VNFPWEWAKVTATECFVLLTIYAIILVFWFSFSATPKRRFYKKKKKRKKKRPITGFQVNAIIINTVAGLAGDASTNYIRAFFVSIVLSRA